MSYRDWKLAELDSVPKNGFRVYSTFACGGGSSMGYKLAGYEIVGINEIDPKLAALYRANFPRTPLIHQMPIQDLLDRPDLLAEIGDIDVLDGSPPCSTFSMAGSREKNWGKQKKFREGQATQVLDDLFFRFIDLAGKIRPRVCVSENVSGITYGNAKGYVAEIAKQFSKIGYRTQLFKLNSSLMGVPQKRERVFFVSVRDDISGGHLRMSFNETPVTYGEIETDSGITSELTDFERNLISSAIPADKDFRHVKQRLAGKRGKFLSTARSVILHRHKVPPTLTSGGMFYSFPGKRRATTGELVRIQSFPCDYNFGERASYSQVKYVLGMSVPPLMMQRVAEAVRDQLLLSK